MRYFEASFEQALDLLLDFSLFGLLALESLGNVGHRIGFSLGIRYRCKRGWESGSKRGPYVDAFSV
jgi:hypothetical protein